MTQTTAIRIGIGLDAATHGGSSGAERAELWSALATRLDGEADFLTLEDGFGRQEQDGPDAVLLANWLGARTRNIGIIAGAAVNFLEPFHISTAIATLDYVTEGRAGLLVQRLAGPRINQAARAAGAFKGFPATDTASLEADATDAVEVIRRLWDSWEDDAVIRDQKTWRFLDGEKLHYIGFASQNFSVLGPSITPRPPQGQPVIATTLSKDDDPGVARSADIVFVQPDAENLSQIHSAGTAASKALLFADTIITHSTAEEIVRQTRDRAEAGFTGIRFNLLDLQRDSEWLLTTALPALHEAGLAVKPKHGATLRERLGLSHPANRYAAAA